MHKPLIIVHNHGLKKSCKSLIIMTHEHNFATIFIVSFSFRKGKIKPLELIEKDNTGHFLELFTNMCDVDGDISKEIASKFVCQMYGQDKEGNVDEARLSKLIQMTGKIDKVCCRKSLFKEIDTT